MSRGPATNDFVSINSDVVQRGSLWIKRALLSLGKFQGFGPEPSMLKESESPGEGMCLPGIKTKQFCYITNCYILLQYAEWTWGEHAHWAQMLNGFLGLFLFPVTGSQIGISKCLAGESKAIWLTLGKWTWLLKSIEIPLNMEHVHMCQLSTALCTTEFFIQSDPNTAF